MSYSRLTRSLAAWLFLSSLCVTGPAVAQWSHNPLGNNPVSTVTNYQVQPVTTSDGHGGAIIAWTDSRSAVADIYIQRIDSAGVTRWTANGVVVTAATDYQELPRIVSDGSGGAIVTWRDFRNGANYDVYAQRIDSLGVARWAANGVSICSTGNHQYSQVISADGAGGAIIAWGDLRSGLNSDIYAQRINSSGAIQWTLDGVAISAAGGNQAGPSMTSDGAGGAVIAWTDDRTGGVNDIYAQRVNASGLVQWAVNGVGVCTVGGFQESPIIVGAGAGGTIMAWHDYRNAGIPDIYAQKVDGAGATAWTSGGEIVCAAANEQYYPAMLGDGFGGAFIAWVDWRSGLTFDVYAQKINTSGYMEWTVNGKAVSTAPGDQWIPAILRDAEGGVIVSWPDGRNGPYSDLYAQRIDTLGGMSWTTDGVPVATANSSQYHQSMVSDGAGGAIICWTDYRVSPVADIYAQNIDALGYLGYNNPVMNAVADVAGDQGGKVTVSWDRSDLDKYPYQDIEYYSVWRGVGPAAIPAGTTFKSPGEIPAEAAPGVYRRMETATGSTYWELLGTVTAHRFPGYSYTAPTLSDSSAAGVSRSKFLVSASTADPFVYWDSGIDSGYSVDNLSPSSVAPVAASVQAGPTVNVHWKLNSSDPDVKVYEVHRSLTSGFIPNGGTVIGQTADTLLLDGAPVIGAINYYKIVTVDLHDNRSAPSAEAPAAVGSTQLYAVQDRWNMVSVPLTLSDYGKTVVFPTATSAAFSYSNGYITSTTLANGPGYWVKFSGAQSVPMTGLLRTAETIPVADGWNMVGSIGSAVDVSTITSTPPGMVTSNFFGYSNGYESSTNIEPGKAYWVKVTGAGTLNLSSVAASGGNSGPHDPSNRIRIEDTGETPPPPPDGALAGDLPADFTLEQNYPNPFNPVTEIRYGIPVSGLVRLSVFNALGQEVMILVDEEQAAGYQSVSFDASGLPSGMYTCRIATGTYTAVRKMMLLK